MRPKCKHRFDRCFLNNRWKRPYCSRPDAWVIIGISKRWHSPESWVLKFCFLGFDFGIVFKCEVKK